MATQPRYLAAAAVGRTAIPSENKPFVIHLTPTRLQQAYQICQRSASSAPHVPISDPRCGIDLFVMVLYHSHLYLALLQDKSYQDLTGTPFANRLVARAVGSPTKTRDAISRERLRVVRVNGTGAQWQIVAVHLCHSLTQLSAVPEISRPSFSKVNNCDPTARATSLSPASFCWALHA